MIAKIKVASLVRDFGIGGTARQVVTIDKYLNPDFFEHIVISLNSGDNARTDFLDASKIFNARDVSEAVKIIESKGIDVLYCHRHGRNEAEYDELAKAIPASVALIELNTFSAKDDGFFDSRCDQHIFVSQTNLLKYLRQNCLDFDFHKYKVVYGLVDVDNFMSHQPTESELDSYRRANGLDSYAVIGRIARPVMGKWDDRLIRFWHKLSAADPKVKFIIYGVPEERKAALLGAGNRDNLIIKEPTISDQELALFYSSIDALLHVSPIGECSCGTIAEAMLFKKPIITNSTPFPLDARGRTHTKDNGQIEQIKNGVNGYIANSAEAMFRAAVELIKNPATAAEIGSRNHQEVLSKYSVAVGIKTLEKTFIQSVMDKKQALSVELAGYFDGLEFSPNISSIQVWFAEYYKRLNESFCPQCRDSFRDQLVYWILGLKRKFKTLLNLIKL